jgi:DNA-binding Lrp family transcriptional regulator
MLKRFREKANFKGTMLEEDKVTAPYLEEKTARTYTHNPNNRQYRMELLVGYLAENGGRKITNKEIAEAIEITEGYVPALVKELCKRGTITRKGKRSTYGYTYTVNHTRVNRKRRVSTGATTPKAVKSVKKAAEKQPAPKQQFSLTSDNVVGLLDTLAWEFIKEVRSTDVVLFLDWVKAKNS